MHGGRLIRVCCRVVVDKSKGSDRDDVITNALDLDGMIREWHLERLRERAVVRQFDLKHLQGVPLVEGLGIYQHDDRFLLTDRLTHDVGEWMPKVIMHNIKTVEEVRDALMGQANPFRGREGALVWVPVDLRFGLDEQLATSKEVLQSAQSFLFRLMGREAPFRTIGENLWRDAFCYLERVHKHRSYKSIASEVFPKEVETKRGAVKASSKVRTIVANARKALRSAAKPLE